MKVVESFSRCFVIFILVLFGAVTLCVVPAFAQATRQLNNVARRIDDFNKQNAQAERDEMNKELRGKKPSAEELKRVAALNSQINDDLESLQAEYNALVTKLKANEPISEKAAAETAERTHARSERLLKNLNLPAPKVAERTEPKAYSGHTNKLLRTLCTRIFEFITDPIFESPGVLDMESANRARTALEEVVRVSDHIRRR